MRSTNKIRERDMDPGFLLSLINNVQSIDVVSLLDGYIKKGDELPRSSLPKDYVNAINDAILKLQTDVAYIKENYRKKSDPITMDDLDENLRKILTALAFFVYHIKARDDFVPIITFAENGERIIIVTDDEGNEYEVVIPIMYDGTGSGGGLDEIDKARLQNQINILDRDMKTLSNSVDTLQRQIKSINDNTGSTLPGNVIINLGDLDIDNIDNETIQQLLTAIVAQASRITALENKIAELEGSGSGSLPSLSSISSKIEQCQRDISDLQDKTSQKVGYNNLVYELQDKFDVLSGIVTRIENVETNKMNKPVLDETGYIYYSAEEGNLLRSRPPIFKAAVCENAEEVIAAQSNNEKFILNLQTGQGFEYDPDKRAYDMVQISKNAFYNNLLIFNTQTEVIDYLVFEGSIVRLDSLRSSNEVVSSARLSVKKINIAAGSSEYVERFNNMKKFPPIVLVRDFEASSRTTGKYINSEGIITISHEEDGFRLYNDYSSELEVLIMAGD